MSIQLNIAIYLFNSFVVYEVLFRMAHKSKSKFLFMAFATVILMAIHNGAFFATKESNSFQVFEVSRKSGDSDIKRAYKSMLRKYHPDKNPDDPFAQDNFIRIKKINEELTNARKRMIYDKYGAQDIREEAEETEYFAFTLSKGILLYFITLIFGVIFTYKSNAKLLCFVMPILFGIAEAALMQVEFEDFIDYLAPSMAIFEKVMLLRVLIGPITCLFRLWFNVFDFSNNENLIRYLENAISIQEKLANFPNRPNPNTLNPLIDNFSQISDLIHSSLKRSEEKKKKEMGQKISFFKNLLYWIMILSLQSSVANFLADFYFEHYH